ncbi:hypothetical protein QTN25_003751 [Entamoeba marina]
MNQPPKDDSKNTSIDHKHTKKKESIERKKITVGLLIGLIVCYVDKITVKVPKNRVVSKVSQTQLRVIPEQILPPNERKEKKNISKNEKEIIRKP